MIFPCSSRQQKVNPFLKVTGELFAGQTHWLSRVNLRYLQSLRKKVIDHYIWSSKYEFTLNSQVLYQKTFRQIYFLHILLIFNYFCHNLSVWNSLCLNFDNLNLVLRKKYEFYCPKQKQVYYLLCVKSPIIADLWCIKVFIMYSNYCI